MDRRVDLLQLREQLGSEPKIAITRRGNLFVLPAQLLVDGTQPGQLAFLAGREPLVLIALGDKPLDRCRENRAFTRLIELPPLGRHYARAARHGAELVGVNVAEGEESGSS